MDIDNTQNLHTHTHNNPLQYCHQKLSDPWLITSLIGITQKHSSREASYLDGGYTIDIVL